jgi:ParB family transcriptional regulator, chromosome partitioning protein
MSRKALGRGLSALFTQAGSIDQELVEVSIDQIEQAQEQPRRIFKEDKLEELAQSIKTNGVIQPLVVRRLGDHFQLIAGERRWRAAQKAGLLRVPCVIKDVPDQRVLEISLIENIQREELNPIEEANAYRRLLEQLELTQEEVSDRVGKDRSSIANTLRLLKLPDDIQKMVEEERLSMGHARALLSLASLDQQRSVATRVIDQALSVRETERLVQKLQNKQPATRKPRVLIKDQANITAAETKLSRRLEAPVRIKMTSSGGSIEIKFSSNSDLSRLYDLLIKQVRTANLQ